MKKLLRKYNNKTSEIVTSWNYVDLELEDRSPENTVNVKFSISGQPIE